MEAQARALEEEVRQLCEQEQTKQTALFKQRLYSRVGQFLMGSLDMRHWWCGYSPLMVFMMRVLELYPSSDSVCVFYKRMEQQLGTCRKCVDIYHASMPSVHVELEYEFTPESIKAFFVKLQGLDADRIQRQLTDKSMGLASALQETSETVALTLYEVLTQRRLLSDFRIWASSRFSDVKVNRSLESLRGCAGLYQLLVSPESAVREWAQVMVTHFGKIQLTGDNGEDKYFLDVMEEWMYILENEAFNKSVLSLDLRTTEDLQDFLEPTNCVKTPTKQNLWSALDHVMQQMDVHSLETMLESFDTIPDLVFNFLQDADPSGNQAITLIGKYAADKKRPTQVPSPLEALLISVHRNAEAFLRGQLSMLQSMRLYGFSHAVCLPAVKKLIFVWSRVFDMLGSDLDKAFQKASNAKAAATSSHQVTDTGIASAHLLKLPNLINDFLIALLTALFDPETKLTVEITEATRVQCLDFGISFWKFWMSVLKDPSVSSKRVTGLISPLVECIARGSSSENKRAAELLMTVLGCLLKGNTRLHETTLSMIDSIKGEAAAIESKQSTDFGRMTKKFRQLDQTSNFFTKRSTDPSGVKDFVDLTSRSKAKLPPKSRSSASMFSSRPMSGKSAARAQSSELVDLTGIEEVSNEAAARKQHSFYSEEEYRLPPKREPSPKEHASKTKTSFDMAQVIKGISHSHPGSNKANQPKRPRKETKGGAVEQPEEEEEEDTDMRFAALFHRIKTTRKPIAVCSLLPFYRQLLQVCMPVLLSGEFQNERSDKELQAPGLSFKKSADYVRAFLPLMVEECNNEVQEGLRKCSYGNGGHLLRYESEKPREGMRCISLSIVQKDEGLIASSHSKFGDKGRRRFNEKLFRNGDVVLLQIAVGNSNQSGFMGKREFLGVILISETEKGRRQTSSTKKSSKNEEEESVNVLFLNDGELDNATASIVKLLKRLGKMDVMLTDLRSTSIGKAVNKLRKHEDAEIKALSSKLKEKWTDLMDKKDTLERAPRFLSPELWEAIKPQYNSSQLQSIHSVLNNYSMGVSLLQGTITTGCNNNVLFEGGYDCTGEYSSSLLGFFLYRTKSNIHSGSQERGVITQSIGEQVVVSHTPFKLKPGGKAPYYFTSSVGAFGESNQQHSSLCAIQRSSEDASEIVNSVCLPHIIRREMAIHPKAMQLHSLQDTQRQLRNSIRDFHNKAEEDGQKKDRKALAKMHQQLTECSGKIRRLRDEVTAIRAKMTETILSKASIIACTLSKAGSGDFSELKHGFDALIIDEAAQAVELSTLVPIRERVARVVLVGDPKQLPATVKSVVAAKAREEDMNGSKYNRVEAAFCVSLCQNMFETCADVRNNKWSVGFVSPYKEQVRVLRQEIARSGIPASVSIEVNTVDGFQGREKDVIVFSCVRSSKRGGIGFLRDIRRLNVAITLKSARDRRLIIRSEGQSFPTVVKRLESDKYRELAEHYKAMHEKATQKSAATVKPIKEKASKAPEAEIKSVEVKKGIDSVKTNEEVRTASEDKEKKANDVEVSEGVVRRRQVRVSVMAMVLMRELRIIAQILFVWMTDVTNPTATSVGLSTQALRGGRFGTALAMTEAHTTEISAGPSTQTLLVRMSVAMTNPADLATTEAHMTESEATDEVTIDTAGMVVVTAITEVDTQLLKGEAPLDLHLLRL
ncbi:hypothetical protein JG687_00011057 [Phytophthora cactorum]|uniref:TFIIS N-terminal domain-containing protein n=1 Tax=Phytophthora cactorum TaxID=29920 RepID=A0A8T1U5L0_9STRA|nr:hypothetical protein JG687_00011057 [Phytophthora cactorum]